MGCGNSKSLQSSTKASKPRGRGAAKGKSPSHSPTKPSALEESRPPTPTSKQVPLAADKKDVQALTLKAMTYNLFWWNLYGQRNGNDGSASKLIALSRPDVIGFQECEDVFRVLREAGLQTTYTAVTGNHATAIAFKTAKYQEISRGQADVAEDEAQQYYGTRCAAWVRARHIPTGRIIFFVNHHGPLRVNTGGRFGGATTARNMWNVVTKNSQPGDAVLSVGDFNATTGSTTVNELSKFVALKYTGVSFGGVDHFFSDGDLIATENLGGGGSDHDALTATFVL